MRIVQVRAGAFGPLRGDSLDLAPGFTVIHGPNEAGKSSWFAATYAGLAGRRKARGRGTLTQAQFAARHKPWAGSQWSAGVTISLDDGTSLALEHDLRKGESRVVDMATRRTLSVAELERRLDRPLTTDGGLDGARILGLNRDALRATIFVAQADVLRVLHDAAELQQLLERVATTESADVTAEAALQWLDRLRVERVGAAHIGNKPLRSRTQALKLARDASVQARDIQAHLVQVLDEQRRVSRAQREVENRLVELGRLQAWSGFREMERRIQQARALERASQEPGAQPFDDEVVRRVTVAIAAFDERGPSPTLPDGPDAAALKQQMDALPPAPEGDLEPSKEAVAARQALAAAETAVSTHAMTAPEVRSTLMVDIDADELRDLAGRLEAPLPEVDASLEKRVTEARARHAASLAAFEKAQAAQQTLADQQAQAQRDYEARWEDYQRAQEDYTRRRAAYGDALAAASREQARRAAEASRTRRTAGLVLTASGLALVAGVALLVLGQVVAGGVLAAIGSLLAIVGSAQRGRSNTSTTDAPPAIAPPTAPVPPQAVRSTPLEPLIHPELDPAVLELEAQIAAHRAAITAATEQRSEAVRRLTTLGLPATAADLRQLARALEDAAAAAVRLEQHRTKAAELEEGRRDAARSLAAVLGSPDAEVERRSGHKALAAAYDEYVDSCRERSKQAAEAARRPGLEQAWRQRVELEEAHARAAADWERHGRRVSELAQELGEAADGPPEASAWLRRWLEEDKIRRSAAAERKERRAALQQLLDGRTLQELELEFAAARPLDPEPSTIPDDIAAQVELLRARREGLLGQAGDLRGQQTQLIADMPSVARALEEEAAAEVALARVQELANGLELATAELQRAKERSHASVAPALQGCIRPWVPQVTRRRYLDVRINPADLTMKVTDHLGAVRDAHLLSHGTTEQLYLLLRVALAQHLASVDETAPLVLDDVTVQSDAARTRALLDLLHQVSQERQVVLFTQEDEVVEWARENLTAAQDVLTTLPDPVAVGSRPR